MNKILLLLLISLALSKDLIIVGDERIKEIAYVLFEAEDSSYTVGMTDYDSPFTEGDNPAFYEDYNIRYITAAEIEHLINNNEITSYLHYHLRNAKPGTNVLLNLGFDNPDLLDKIIIFYGKLADKYLKLNFYYVPIIGVDQSKSTLSNEKFKEFNKLLDIRITNLEFPNLKSKNILYEDDPTKVAINGEPVDIFKYSTDGTGFFRNGLTRIFNAMVEGLEFESEEPES
jgi:hypothetical protein